MNTGGQSRTERQVRNQGRVLLWVGLVLLGACMAMTAAFGVSYGRSTWEKALLATGLAGVDILGGTFVALSATYFSARARAAGSVLIFVAAFCFVITLGGIIGFQGDNREATAQKRERDVKIDTDQLDWLRGQTTTSPKQEKQSMLGEVKKQIDTLKSTDMALPDAFSSVVAPILGVKETDVRRYAVVGVSSVLLAAAYMALWFYGYTHQRVAPIIAAQSLADSRQFVGGKVSLPENSAVFTKAAARADLVQLLDGGFSLKKYGAFSQLARRWGWTVNKTVRWLSAQQDLAGLLPDKRKPSPAHHVNGNGRVMAS